MHAYDKPEKKDAAGSSRSTAKPVNPYPESLLALQRSIGNAAVTELIQRSAVPDVLRSPGSPLDDQTRTEMETRLGADFSDVRLHRDAEARRSAAELGARAYTSGNHVVIGDGGADPHTLAHELFHVVQQRNGPVDGTDTGDGYQVSDPTDRFEREAEAVASRAMKPALQRTVGDDTEMTVQRAPDDGDTVESAEAGTARAELTASLLSSPSLVRKTVRAVGRDLAVNREVRAALLKRLKKGPLFSDADLAVIQRCDPAWLRAIGIGGYQDAAAYHAARNYKEWLKQEPGKRLLVATIAWNRDSQPDHAPESHKSPAYTLGRELRLRKPEGLSPDQVTAITNEQNRQIRDTFVETLLPGQATPEERDTAQKVDRARDILTRIFLILQNGLKVYKEGDHMDYRDGDVARALAHGGRVNIRIPQLGEGDTPFDLPNWIGLTTDGQDTDPAERRSFSSHRMSIGKNKDGVAGTGSFEERGGFLTGAGNLVVHELGSKLKLPVENSRTYGIDVAAGGWRSRDFNSDVVTPDGGHGHLFVRFQPPDAKTDGALQIGIETTAPGAASPVGYEHTWRSTEKTANPESSFYGHKQNKIGEGKLADNQRMVKLQEFTTETRGWQDFLRSMEEYWNQLREQADSDPEQRRKLYEQLVGPRENLFQPPSAAGPTRPG